MIYITKPIMRRMIMNTRPFSLHCILKEFAIGHYMAKINKNIIFLYAIYKHFLVSIGILYNSEPKHLDFDSILMCRMYIIRTGISIIVVGRLIVALIRKSRSFGFQCLGFQLGLNKAEERIKHIFGQSSLNEKMDVMTLGMNQARSRLYHLGHHKKSPQNCEKV